MTHVASAKTLTGQNVVNPIGEKLGEVKEFMIDVDSGRVEYAVLAFGGVLGVGDKLFAVPMQALQAQPDEECFVLDVDKKILETAPGFDKDNWPNMADTKFATAISRHYGYV